MSELLVTGMAYLDVFVPPVTPPPAGQELLADAITLSFGGALNSASVGKALGLQVTLAVPVGDGIADHALVRQAARLGIALKTLHSSDDPAISLVLSAAGERAFVSAADYSALDRVERLPGARWILVTGLEEAARLAAPLARARQAGAAVAVSGSWAPQRLAEMARQHDRPWDLLVLNEDEATCACADASHAPVLLQGVARSIVVTLGSAGAHGIIDGVAVRTEARAVEVCDSTGAGDAFCAGLLAGLIRGLAAGPALEAGACAAAHVLQQRGGMLHDPVRVAALAKEMPWMC